MKKKILIIEDQLPTRKLLSHYLGNFYDIIEMQDGEEALTWLKKGHRPHVIVSDIILPGMTGAEFLQQMSDEGISTPPVLMLTSIENSSERMKCFHLGARDYLTKPFNPEELRIRISHLLQ